MATKTATVLIRLDFYVYIFPLSLLKAHLVLISVVKIINCSRLFDHIFQQLEVPREFIKDHIIIGTTWYVRKKIWRNLEEIWYDCYDQSCLKFIPWGYPKLPCYKSYFQLSSQCLKMCSTWSLTVTSNSRIEWYKIEYTKTSIMLIFLHNTRIQILIKRWNSGLQWILLWSIIKDANNQ